jgi:hypothetical protein
VVGIKVVTDSGVRILLASEGLPRASIPASAEVREKQTKQVKKRKSRPSKKRTSRKTSKKKRK